MLSSSQDFNLRPFASPEDLQRALAAAGVDTSSWGKGATKSIENLFQEWQSGEASFGLVQGQFVRTVKVVRAAVTATDGNNQPMVLVEDRQVFVDGSCRRRIGPWAMWEKLKPGETPRDGAARGFSEELGFSPTTIEATQTQPEHGIVTLEPPKDYPNLPTLTIAFDFAAHLGTLESPTGFREHDRQKTTVFEFRPAEAALVRRGESLLASPQKARAEQILCCAQAVHEQLVGQPHGCDKRGILTLSEIGTAGMIAAALSAFNGSSSYLHGGLAPTVHSFLHGLEKVNCRLTEIPEKTRRELQAFQMPRNLPSSLCIANTVIPQPPYGVEVGISIEHESRTFFLPTSNSAVSSISDAVQETVTILTLELLLNKLGVPVPMDPFPFPAHTISKERLDQLQPFNAEVWNDLSPLIIRAGHSLAIGESFTGGKVAALTSRTPHNCKIPPLTLHYLWYSPSWKETVGVPSELLEPSTIGSPQTVIAGSSGLLSTLAPKASLGLGTTGWANRTPADGPDNFSIAVVTNPQLTSSNERRALHATVTATADEAPSLWKRALTRELGVSASLLLLTQITRACSLTQLSHADQNALDALEQRIMTAISPLATLG